MTNQRKLKTGDRITTRIMVRRWTFAVFAAAFSTGLMATVRGQTPGDVQPEDPKPILMRMAGFMATNNFSVDVSDSYDVVQESGQKIEFNEKRKITVARPDRLHIAVEESDGEQSVLLFDGKVITMSTPSQDVYAQTPKPGTLDDAIIFFVHDLGMRIPFAPLLISTAPAELARRTKTLEYVEETSIFGKPAHHLAGRTSSINYQIWIASGDEPLPVRLVLTYPEDEGQPQFRAQFSNWNLSPAAPASLFTFTPPAGAQKISFLAQLPRSTAPVAEPVKPNPSKSSKGQP